MLEFLSSRSIGEVLGLAGIAGVVVIAVPAVILGNWRRMREARLDAELKRDLVAKEVSIENVLRLTAPASVREAEVAAEKALKRAQVEADARIQEAQIAADLKRDLLARGLSVADVERLAAPEPGSQAKEDSRALATAIGNMIQEESLDGDAVAALLAAFAKRARPDEADRVEQECQSIGAAIAGMVQEGGELDQDAVADLLAIFLRSRRHAGDSAKTSAQATAGEAVS